MGAYVHGYGALEAVRLQDQAESLAGLLHADTAFPPGTRVLEAGCGVGAQTVSLARNSPGARITAVDISAASLAQARRRLADAGRPDVAFLQADILAPPFRPGSFDALFVCFVLEHLADPVGALRGLVRLVRPGGAVTVVEGDHGTIFFHPESAAARAAIRCQVELQRRAGGDALLGRRLYPLLAAAGLDDIHVSPRIMYVDGSRPALADGFTLKTFTAMIDGVRGEALEAGLSTPEDFAAGIRDLRRAAEPDGTFSYTFLKATATVGRPT